MKLENGVVSFANNLTSDSKLLFYVYQKKISGSNIGP